MNRAVPFGIARPQIPSRRITVCKVIHKFIVMGTACPDVRGMCQRPGVRTDLHMFVVVGQPQASWGLPAVLTWTAPSLESQPFVARSLLLPASGVVDDIGKSNADRNIDFEYIQGLIFLS